MSSGAGGHKISTGKEKKKKGVMVVKKSRHGDTEKWRMQRKDFGEKKIDEEDTKKLDAKLQKKRALFRGNAGELYHGKREACEFANKNRGALSDLQKSNWESTEESLKWSRNGGRR